MIVQSPVPCLVSPHEQNIEIQQYMESEICIQDVSCEVYELGSFSKPNMVTMAEFTSESLA